MALEEYRQKRHFEQTPEPAGGSEKPQPGSLRFVVQKHRATRLHYDFRLELDDVMKSWAVPKGPSMNPEDKRLAMMVEDHPLEYRTFEGIIPKGNYGAGTVMVWDEGYYQSYEETNLAEQQVALRRGLNKGHLGILINGQKLRGAFDLIKLHGEDENAWLLVKRKDVFATSQDVLEQDRSVSTGRTMEEIAAQSEAQGDVWISNKGAEQLDLGDAPEGPMPRDIAPMLAVAVEKPFDRDGWVFEVKWDGYRVIAEVDVGGRVTLSSRNSRSLTERFRSVADALAPLGHQLVLDGEVVLLDERGRSHFEWLQNYPKKPQGVLAYYVFDILYADGHDLTSLPLVRRKMILRELLPEIPMVRYSDHIEDKGCDFFEVIKQQNLEGMIGKNGQSSYLPGKRSEQWKKVKAKRKAEVVIGGYVEQEDSSTLASLIAGRWEPGGLAYAGHIGTGFDTKCRRLLIDALAPLQQDQSPFGGPVEMHGPTHWVKPEIRCVASFTEWTLEGRMRHPVFVGVSPGQSGLDGLPVAAPLDEAAANEADADVDEDPPEQPAGSESEATKTRLLSRKDKALVLTIDGQEVKISNPEKIYWPDDRLTKLDMVNYYRSVAALILPHLAGRPESLHRFPDGIRGEGFFQKNVGELVPDWIVTERVDSSQDGEKDYLIITDEASLVYVANLGAIEMNPWLSRVGHLTEPDFAVIDFDPEDIAFEAVVEAALALHEVLDKIGVPGYPKTSGATGIHVGIPLGAKYDYDVARQFAEILATMVNQRLPRTTSLVRNPAKRQKRVYVDFLQNRRGSTIASAYSVRPHPGAPTSAPLRWEEVDEKLNPRDFTIRTLPERARALGDLWQPVLADGIDLETAIGKLAALS